MEAFDPDGLQLTQIGVERFAARDPELIFLDLLFVSDAVRDDLIILPGIDQPGDVQLELQLIAELVPGAGFQWRDTFGYS